VEEEEQHLETRGGSTSSCVKWGIHLWQQIASTQKMADTGASTYIGNIAIGMRDVVDMDEPN
jgi:hypothetical protein